MNTPLIIILLVFVGLVGLYLYKHSRHVGLAADSERLHATLKTIYREAGKPALSQNRLLKELKARFHVNEKVALVLISKLRREGFIKGTPDAYELASTKRRHSNTPPRRQRNACHDHPPIGGQGKHFAVCVYI